MWATVRSPATPSATAMVDSGGSGTKVLTTQSCDPSGEKPIPFGDGTSVAQVVTAAVASTSKILVSKSSLTSSEPQGVGVRKLGLAMSGAERMGVPCGAMAWFEETMRQCIAMSVPSPMVTPPS